MKREERRNELIKEMEGTGIMMKDKYPKAEVEQGYRDFQEMLVKKVFNEKHSKTLRMEDAISHLNDLACELNLQNSKEMNDFISLAKEFKKLIAMEIAGNKGERLVNRSLKMVTSNNRMLSNIEFGEDEIRTECDKIVLTDKAIFLIEVKSAKHNMMITEEGNYVREDGLVYGNIGEKINEKEYLVRNAIKNWAKENSKDIHIVKLVVFANNSYTLQDNYKYLTSCYCSTLPHIIDEYDGEILYTESDISAIQSEIEKASDPKEYEVELDFNEFRHAFAELLALIEEERVLATEDATEVEHTKKSRKNHKKLYINLAKAVGYGMTAGASFILATKVQRGLNRRVSKCW